MTIEEIMQQINEGKTKEEKTRLLRTIRGELLDEIHCKQQILDQVDYVLYKMKKE